MTKINSTKPRSKRLRKKLHIGEFKQNYVQVYFKIRKSNAEMMDIDAWCDFHDLLFDLVIEAGAEPGCASSSHNEIEISFTQYDNQPDKTQAVVDLLAKNVDVYLNQVFVSPPVDVYHWHGWELDDPFDLIYSLSYLARKA